MSETTELDVLSMRLIRLGSAHSRKNRVRNCPRSAQSNQKESRARFRMKIWFESENNFILIVCICCVHLLCALIILCALIVLPRLVGYNMNSYKLACYTLIIRYKTVLKCNLL